MSKRSLQPWTKADLEVAVREIRACFEESDCHTPECAADAVLRALRHRLEDAARAERERILGALTERMIKHDVIADHAVVTARALEEFIAAMRASPLAPLPDVPRASSEASSDARVRGPAMTFADFRVGLEFRMDETTWRCTDVEPRVIAVQVDEVDRVARGELPREDVLQLLVDRHALRRCTSIG